MNLITFPVGSTNIFPLANSHAGGQLLTEYNLRSRETVITDENVTYSVGMSFTHSLQDFEVDYLRDNNGTSLGSNSVLEIAPGRAVINGHYVESLTAVTIDMLDLNAKLLSEGESSLLGELKVGIYMAYSTEQTLAGSLQPEVVYEEGSTDPNVGYYRGVQVVILPSSEFITPSDSPTDENQVTAHLLLATFTFLNGQISNIKNNEDKIQCIPFSRISDFSSATDEGFLTRRGLMPHHLYVVPGTPTNEENSFQVATGSLFKWEKNPEPVAGSQPTGARNVSKFVAADNGVYLNLVHLQNANFEDVDGQVKYYPDVQVPLPSANFVSGSSGVVSKAYTDAIKQGISKIEEIYKVSTGTCRAYIDVLEDFSDLPGIQSGWKFGDYVVVRDDHTQVIEDDSDVTEYPSTMYVVLPGFATAAEYYSDSVSSTARVIGSTPIQSEWETSDDPMDILDPCRVTFDWSTSFDNYICVPYNSDPTGSGSTINYYYKVTQVGPKSYDPSPIRITGQMYLATDSSVGGFYNISADDDSLYGNGYVVLDSSGHLRVVDYDLLVTGVLAYQLGEDVTIPGGLEYTEVQSMLDQYVNQRVAFSSKVTDSSDNVINVTIDLSSNEAGSSLKFGDIDSRFGTYVNLHLTGEADESVAFDIYNCEKLKIDVESTCRASIHVFNSCIHYDSELVNRLAAGRFYNLSDSDQSTGWMEGVTFWAEESDPFFIENGLKVVFKNIIPSMSSDVGDWWSTELSNDNRFLWATRSISFSNDGQIVGLEMYVASSSTNNSSFVDGLFLSDWTFDSSAVSVPTNCITGKLKVSGSFVSAYMAAGGIISLQNIDFSAFYDPSKPKGNIIISSKVQNLTSVTGIGDYANNVTTLSGTGFEPGTYHLFSGGLIE